MSYLDELVIVRTELGELVGEVKGVSVRPDGPHVSVLFPTSGSTRDFPLESVRPAGDGHLADLQRDLQRARLLTESARRVEADQPPPYPPHVQEIIADAVGLGLTWREAGGFVRINGREGRRVYVSRNGSRVDMVKVRTDHPSMRDLTDSEAVALKVGRVRATGDRLDPTALAEIWKNVREVL
jgi:hypothetical protein